jgi:uncharacterized membrane protein YfcA
VRALSGYGVASSSSVIPAITYNAHPARDDGASQLHGTNKEKKLRRQTPPLAKRLWFAFFHYTLLATGIYAMIFFSPVEPLYYLLPLAGFVVGLFGTMIGGGGGFFFLPLLTLVMDVTAQTAVTTSLVATLPICVLGSWGHMKHGNVNLRIGAYFAVFGVMGAFLGSGIAAMITAGQLETGFSIYAMLMASYVAIHARGEKRSGTEKDKIHSKKNKPARMASGGFFAFMSGILTGAFGTSGTASVLTGLFTFNIPVKMVFGTSLTIVLVNTLFAIGAHIVVSSIDMTLVGFLSVGSAIGAIAGTRLSARLNIEKAGVSVKYIFAAVMLTISLLMIFL